MNLAVYCFDDLFKVEKRLIERLNPGEPAWLDSLKASLPLDLSYIPIGLACGILLRAAGFNPWLAVMISILVFSGGAQFIIASLVLIKSPLYSVVLMMFFLELRYALLGSSLSKYLHGRSNRFTFLFAISLNDENYAINYLKFTTDKNWLPADALKVEHYSLLFWTVSNLVGNFVGNVIAINLNIVEFALTALFLYMIVVQTKDFLKLIVVVFSIVISILMIIWLKSTLGIVIAAVVSSLLGYMIESLIRRRNRRHYLLKTFKNPAGRPKEDLK